MQLKFNKPVGQSLIEVLIAMMVFSVGLAVFWVMYLNALNSNRASAERAKANHLAAEGLEAVRALRDENMNKLIGGTWGLNIVNDKWALGATSDTQDIYTRQVQIAYLDPNTVSVTSTVSWKFNPNETLSTSFNTRFTNWRRFLGRSWEFPRIVTTTEIYGHAQPLGIFIRANYLFISTAVANGSSWFLIYDISDETNPILIGKASMSGPLNVVRVEGDYAFTGGSAEGSSEVFVFDISTLTKPTQISSIKITGSAIVNGLSTGPNRLYVVRDRQGGQNTLLVYDTSNPRNIKKLGGINLGDGAYEVFVRNSTPPFAFIASQNPSQELQVVNVTDPSRMLVGGSADLTGVEYARSVAVTGTLAFVGSNTRSAAGEFYTYDITNPLNPIQRNSLELGGTVKGVSVKRPIPLDYNEMAFLATASSSKEFMAIDLEDLVQPKLLGWKQLPGNGMDIANTTDTAYVVTDNPSAGLVVLQPGP